jgi:hypothetical protein
MSYGLWRPGWDVRDGRHDLGKNGIWMQHGWLGDDEWMNLNNKNAGLFRQAEKVDEMAKRLAANHIRYVYPHLCPTRSTGEIAGSDYDQVERFLDAMGKEGIEVLPWVGGVREGSAQISDVKWREQFAVSCAALIAAHPRLAGIHVNIEPMPSGDRDYLLTLDGLRHMLPPGKTVSVAAYPPPTRWQAMPEVHWDEAYSREVGKRADQVVVMMYDTSLRSGKLYEQLMKDWTREALAWYAPKEVLLGVPAYEDAGASYHDQSAENLEHSLSGIHAGLGAGAMPADYAGVCVYCEWEMTQAKWQVWRERFLSTEAPKGK